jgi:hypothetical protein
MAVFPVWYVGLTFIFKHNNIFNRNNALTIIVFWRDWERRIRQHRTPPPVRRDETSHGSSGNAWLFKVN